MANWNGDKEKLGSVPELLNEREAAMMLRVKAATVRAERIRGKIAYTRIGARIFYTLQQVSDYLERQSVPACTSTESNVQVKSGATGSAKSQAETALKKHGAAPGMTHGLDRHLVSALAPQIFARRASSSPHGLSQTSDHEKPRRTKS